MPNDNEEIESDPINYALHLLQSMEEKGKLLSKESRKLEEAGQNAADLARAVMPFVKYTDPQRLEPFINDLEVTNRQFDHALAHLHEITPSAVGSTDGTITASVSSTFSTTVILPFLPPSDRVSGITALAKLDAVLNRAADEQEVMSLMRSFGLNRAPKGKKSPLSLFTTAYRAFKTPITEDNPASTSLIPLRESIRLTIDHFLKRRIHQEETKTEISKITSIGSQLAYDAISSDIIESWAQQWYELLNKYLSSAKDQDFSREEWQSRLRHVTLWLKAFLSGLDPLKVNRKK